MRNRDEEVGIGDSNVCEAHISATEMINSEEKRNEPEAIREMQSFQR